MRYKQGIVQRVITKSTDIFEFLKPQEIFKNTENEIKSGTLHQLETTIANRQKEKEIVISIEISEMQNPTYFVIQLKQNVANILIKSTRNDIYSGIMVELDIDLRTKMAWTEYNLEITNEQKSFGNVSYRATAKIVLL